MKVSTVFRLASNAVLVFLIARESGPWTATGIALILLTLELMGVVLKKIAGDLLSDIEQLRKEIHERH